MRHARLLSVVRRGAIGAETLWIGFIALAGLLAWGRSETSPTLGVEESQPGGQPEGPPPIHAWYLTASGMDAKGKTAEVKTAAGAAAFVLKPGETLAPELAPGAFNATFSGLLTITRAGPYTLFLDSEGGAASLTVFERAGAKLAEVARPAKATAAPSATPVLKLAAGSYNVSVKFQRPGDAAARLRVLWQLDKPSEKNPYLTGFFVEPVPLAAIAAPPHGRESVETALLAQRGRVLLGEFGCVKCHATDAAISRRTAPLMRGIGSRVNPEWLREWITDPQKVKPGCGMPTVFAGKDAADIDAVVHFLVSRAGPVEWEAPATEPAGIAQGRKLFHTVGCVACHGALEAPAVVFNEPTLANEVPKTPVHEALGPVGRKWSPPALAEFLRDPSLLHPGGRMPSLSLSKEEADFIATYLVNKLGPSEKPAEFKIDPKKVETGMAVFGARGCSNCHDMAKVGVTIPSTMKAKALADLNNPGKTRYGCLNPKDAKTPRYALSEEESEALVAGITAARRQGAWPCPTDRAARTIEALNCRGCHQRDGEGGVPVAMSAYFRTLVEADLGDEGRIPPILTGVGWKLTTPWLTKVLTAGGRARPYMAARMPQFGAEHVGMLAGDLAACEGVSPDSDVAEPASSDENVLAGRRLAGDSGLKCIRCHVFGKAPPVDVPGPSLTDFASRIRFEWFRAYVRDPSRFKPGTKMTNFFEGGKATNQEVFKGDVAHQIDGLWSYCNLGFAAPPPEGVTIGSNEGTTLIVGDRPMVVRTFLKDAGSRGIAVGFPIGVNFAFDAEACRLASAWKGEFLDASGIWKNRGGQVAGGRGPTQWNAPEGPELSFDPPVGAPSFLGYSLDKAGVPTFLYRAGAATVRETFAPGRGHLLRREFSINGHAGAKLTFHAGAGTIEAASIDGCTVETTLKDGQTQVRITPSGAGEVKFTVEVTP